MLKDEDKKIMINNLLAINFKLDVYRTNLNILMDNIYNNTKMKELPKFNFEKAKQILNLFGDLLNGTLKNYGDILQQILSKPLGKTDANAFKNVIDQTKKEGVEN